MTTPTSDTTAPAPAGSPEARLASEVARRRTFAIISHPDAGKTTLTEKLLLYGGAIHLAGSVKARRQARHATSDWMKLEQERGISVTSSVMQFEYDGYHINLLDTPGHEDFSEDTYRTLVAADSAVMLLDNRKGVEERTRQLFEVCKRRRMPIFTFVNKCDRVGEDPLKLISDVEADLGIDCHPVTWPIYRDGDFVGVYDRRQKQVTLFERTADHGATRAETLHVRPGFGGTRGRGWHERAGAAAGRCVAARRGGASVRHEALLAGELSPVFFGSALTNFGVEPFLQEFLELAPAPTPRESTTGPVIAAQSRVHRVRLQDPGEHGPEASRPRRVRAHLLRPVRAGHAGDARAHGEADAPLVAAAVPGARAHRHRGGVAGRRDRRHGSRHAAHRRHALRGRHLEFQGIPRFAPEHFARIVLADPMKRKQLDTGLRQLTEEGAAQVFYADGAAGPTPIVGAVGMLQFDVMASGCEHEYGAPCRIEKIGFRYPRWVVGPAAAIDRAASVGGRLRLYDAAGHPVMIFENEWSLRTVQEFEKGLQFLEAAP